MIPGDWKPVPVPLGDPRHDIGDDARAAIALRLATEFTGQHGLSQEQARQLGMWAAASVRALLHELGILHDMSGPSLNGQREGVRGGDLLQRCCNHPDAAHELICCACQTEEVEPSETVSASGAIVEPPEQPELFARQVLMSQGEVVTRSDGRRYQLQNTAYGKELPSAALVARAETGAQMADSKKPCDRWNWWSHAVLVGTEHCNTCGFLKSEHLSERQRKKARAATGGSVTCKTCGNGIAAVKPEDGIIECLDCQERKATSAVGERDARLEQAFKTLLTKLKWAVSHQQKLDQFGRNVADFVHEAEQELSAALRGEMTP